MDLLLMLRFTGFNPHGSGTGQKYYAKINHKVTQEEQMIVDDVGSNTLVVVAWP